MSVYYDQNCHLPKKNHFENADRQTDRQTRPLIISVAIKLANQQWQRASSV